MLALFPLSVCFPLSQHQDPCPRGGGAQKQGVPLWALCSCWPQTVAQDVSYALAVQAPATVSITPLRHSGFKSLLSLTAYHCPQPLSPLPCLEPHCRASLPHVDSQHISGCELWWSGQHQSPGLLLMCCLSKASTMATVTPPRCCPRMEPLLPSAAELSPWPWQP